MLQALMRSAFIAAFLPVAVFQTFIFFVASFTTPTGRPLLHNAPASLEHRSAMALKHGVLIFIACLFSFWVGVYINTLHDVVLEGEGRLRVIGRNFMNKLSPSSHIVFPPPQTASSFNSSMHGPLVRVTDSFSFITGTLFEHRTSLSERSC
jgi:hypothetical protein